MSMNFSLIKLLLRNYEGEEDGIKVENAMEGDDVSDTFLAHIR